MADNVQWENGRPEVVFLIGFDAWTVQLEEALYALLRQFEAEIEAWMKVNAPWQDITGNARQTLATEVERMVGEITLKLMHGVSYGVYLEYAHQGRFSVLQPAMDYFIPRIWEAIERLFQ